MSLINDALKRANEAPPPPPSVPSRALQAANDPPQSRLPIYLIPVVLLFVVGLAVWFLAKALEVARHVYKQSAAPARVEARETTAPYESAPDQTALLHPAVGSPTTASTFASGAAQPSAQPPVLPVPPVVVQPTFPELKLQALFYRPSHPTAVINSKAVEIGSRINGATVLSITRGGVQVMWQGQTRELLLP